ncbi:Triacylglycerol lipase [Bertholletia excelsa]
MDSHWLHHLFSIYFSILRCILLPFSHLKRFPVLVALADAAVSFHYRLCGLSRCTVDLDDQTSVHFWAAAHRRHDKPNLVLIHGYGSNATWQFLRQVGDLSRSFNLYVPDLLFFGHSYTARPDRSELFQARCVCEGLRRVGVDRFSVYAISYGGWVGYKVAEMWPAGVEKLVMMSSGVGFTAEQREEHLGKIGRKNVLRMLCPEKPEDIRLLVKTAMHKRGFAKWMPDFFLWGFIAATKKYRKERMELVEYLFEKKSESDLPVIPQETLLIWGDQDQVFPVSLAHQLQRRLGPKSRLEIVKGTGHGANMESPHDVNKLIKSFVLS